MFGDTVFFIVSYRCILFSNLKSSEVPDMSESSQEFLSLIQKDMAVNVYRDGQWGSFRHIPIRTGK